MTIAPATIPRTQPVDREKMQPYSVKTASVIFTVFDTAIKD